MNQTLKKSLKFVFYIGIKVLGVLIILWLIYNVFMTALNTMNINVLVKDAFTKRASVILDPIENKDTALLNKLFSEEYLNKSGLDTQTDNKFYDVSLYMQRTDVKLKIVLPSKEEAEIEVTDIVDDIRATIVNSDDPEFAEKTSLMESGKYIVKVIKTESGWIINDIEMVETIVPEYFRPLPTLEPAVEEASIEEEIEEVIEEVIDEETVE